jgi:DNA-binding XRE family transcriptional regulator
MSQAIDTNKNIERAIEQLKAAVQEAIEQNGPRADMPFTRIEDVATLITAYRKEHSLSKGDFTLIAGVTPHTMRRFESDPTSMRVDTLISILQSFGMTLYAGPID